MKKIIFTVIIFLIATMVAAKFVVAETGQFEPSWTYIVKPGDTLSGISARYLEDGFPETWKELAQELDIKDSDKIYPGQVIRLPHVYAAVCGREDTGWSRDLQEIEDSMAIKMVFAPDLKCRIKTKAPRWLE
ncbi:MAG: LysM domain-containing protein [Patescibacteria group bacterium]